ncbi:CDP-glycerol glycerophosphotransferase family protein [Lachnospiraceae bacterium ZAX-1]
MEQGFWQKLQRVKIKDLVHIIFFLLACPISFVYRRFRKDLWLICDNENEARDNGYWLYRYIVNTKKDQDVMYAINKKSPDYIRVKQLGKIVSYGGFAHWIYYLTASKNISSQKGGKPNAAICYVLEVNGLLKNTRIFLQHGITKDDMQFLYYKNTKMSLFVCAVEKEYDYVSKNFGYPAGGVLNLGFCRFDNLFPVPSAKKKILVMPTWRNWIGAPTSKSYQYENIKDFRNTEYFKQWNGFLKSIPVQTLLEEQDIELIFYPHREMQGHLHYFQLDTKSIVLAKWPEYDVQDLLKEAILLVTDYSSVAMDFAYMKKALLYYQFDYEMYRNGHYAAGYFDYKDDGFGEVCGCLEELETAVLNLCSHNFKMEEPYRQRADEFFAGSDRENCRRNFEAIKEL